MKLLIEEYQYDVADVTDVLDGLFTLQDVEQRVSVSYVGYYHCILVILMMHFISIQLVMLVIIDYFNHLLFIQLCI